MAQQRGRPGQGKDARHRDWYRPAADSEARIEAIRAAYKTRFRQESVMRVDGVSCVSF